MILPNLFKRRLGIGRRSELIAVAIFLLAAIAAIEYVPDLGGYYRFERSVNLFADEDTAGGGPFPRLTDVCVLCHGFNGNAVNEFYPRLAGQPAAYLAAQIRAFASGARTDPNMAPLARTLTEAEIRQLGDYFARQRPTAAIDARPESVDLERGIAIAAQLNCAACHGTDFAGHDQFPRLATQSTVYLSRVLQAFKSGARRDPTGAMNLVVASLSPQEMTDVAYYVSHPSQHSAGPPR